MKSILVINPNTSTQMTDDLRPIIARLGYHGVAVNYFTAPPNPTVLTDRKTVEGIVSINSGRQSALSALHCFPHVKPLVPHHNGFLIACYSAHPLVGMLKEHIAKLQREQSRPARKYVVGIFEASVSTSLALMSGFHLCDPNPDHGLEKSIPRTAFGIVTTGTIWKSELTAAVSKLLLRQASSDPMMFAGVETTGLAASELHDTGRNEVSRRMEDATKQLIGSAKNSGFTLAAICLGCAGMSGMEDAVRKGCIDALGLEEGEQVLVIDGVAAGLGMLVTAISAGS